MKILQMKNNNHLGILVCILGSSKPVNMESPENLRSSKYVDKVSFLDLNNGRSDLDNWNWVFKTLLPGMPNMTARRQPNVSLTTKASEL